jgi:hypothetical protein
MNCVGIAGGGESGIIENDVEDVVRVNIAETRMLYTIYLTEPASNFTSRTGLG